MNMEIENTGCKAMIVYKEPVYCSAFDKFLLMFGTHEDRQRILRESLISRLSLPARLLNGDSNYSSAKLDLDQFSSKCGC